MNNDLRIKTNIGFVPSDWNKVKMGEIITEVNRFSKDDNIVLYSLTINKGLICKPEKYEREFLVKSQEDNYKIIEKDEFALNPMNLRFGAISKMKDNTQARLSKYYNIFKCNELVDSNFLEMFLKSERVLNYYNKMATGTLEEKKRVHFSQFTQFEFYLPILTEQKRIAEILSTWDLAIEKQEQLIEKKKEFKKGLMQRLLSGEVRFKEFKDKWFKSSISKIAKIGIGKTPDRKNNNYWGGGYKWLSIGDMKSKNISNTKEEITQLAIEECKMKIVPKDTLIMSFKLTLGKVAILNEDMYTNEAICNFNINKKIINRDYLYYYLDFVDVSRFGSLAAKGITLNQETLSGIIIKYPCLEEQKKIAGVLIASDKEIELLEKELEALKLQKKGLMQRLLTGEVRVKV